MGLFGNSTGNLQEQLRAHKRTLDRSIRELDRERQGLETQEKRLIVDIKKLAKQDQMGCAKIMAKDLVRTRHHIQKFYKMRTELQAVALRVQTLKSTQAMADSMKGVTKVMARMNRSMNLPQMQRIMMDFERQNQSLEMKGEMMSDAIDDAFEEEGDEAESDQVIQRVFEEIGIDIAHQMSTVPSGELPMGAQAMAAKPQAIGVGAGGGGGGPSRPSPSAGAPPPPPPAPGGGAGADLDADLQARLDNLRR